MTNQTMLSRTISLLQARKGNWRLVCKETRLDYEWLNKVARGEIKDPGVNKIQRLHDYLVASQPKRPN